MPPYTFTDERVSAQKMERQADSIMANPRYSSFQQLADKNVHIKQEAIVLEEADEDENEQPNFAVLKAFLSCEICTNVPMLPIMQCDHCGAQYCEHCLVDYNQEKLGLTVDGKKEDKKAEKEDELAAEAKDAKDAEPKPVEDEENMDEDTRREQAKADREEKERLEQKFKKQIKCKACHKTLKAKKKKAAHKGKKAKKDAPKEEEDEESDEMQIYYDDYGTEMKRLKKVKYSSRIARNLLRHLEFKHACEGEGEEAEELVLSYEEFVRHCRFACRQVREFKCLQQKCSTPDKKMSKKELEEHLVTECTGVQVTCDICQVSLARSEFSGHDCHESQLSQIRKLRTFAAEQKQAMTDMNSKLREAEKKKEEVQKEYNEIQNEYYKYNNEFYSKQEEMNREARKKMAEYLEEKLGIQPIPVPATYIKKQKENAEKMKKIQKARRGKPRKGQPKKKEEDEEVFDLGNLFGDYGEEEEKVENGGDQIQEKQAEVAEAAEAAEEAKEEAEEEVNLMGLFDDDYGDEIIPDIDEEVLEIPEEEKEREPTPEELAQQKAKDEHELSHLVPYHLKNDYNIIYSMYAYNEEGHPYYTPFYKCFDYAEEAHDSKLVIIRKYRESLGRCYVEFQRNLVIRGIGIRSANCCPGMDPVEAYIFAKVPDDYKYRSDMDSEMRELAQKLGLNRNDLNGLWLVKHVEDFGFSEQRLELKQILLDNYPIVTKSLQIFVMSTKNTVAKREGPYQGMQFKRFYIYH